MYHPLPTLAASIRSGGAVVLIGILAVLAVGCTTTTKRVHVDPIAAAEEAQRQSEYAARDYLSNKVRLEQISFPLLLAATEFCEDDLRRGIGVSVANKYMFPKELRSAVYDLWTLGDELRIVGVVPNSPADRAGIEFGDLVVEIDNREVKSGKKAAEHFLKLMRDDLQDREVDLVVDRQGERVALVVVPEDMCDYPMLLNHDDAVNAFADGRSVILTTGMLRFAPTDNELAVVVGHEIAHNAMGHLDKKMVNYALGSIFDIAAAVYGVNTQGAFGNMGAGAFSQDFEAEADYVGLYILARADFPIYEAPDFWRKMAVAHPSSIKGSHGATHPPTPERFIALQNTVARIKHQQESGEELTPSYKKDEAE